MKKNHLTRYLAIILSLVLVLVNGGLATAASVSFSRIVLTANELSLVVDETSTLTATAIYSDNSSSGVTASTIWSSSNSTVATVYNGVVSAKEAGKATITAVYVENGKESSQAVVVTVTKKVKALTQDKNTITVRKGESSGIVLTATYSDNTTDATVSNQAVWTTNNAAVATVVNGTVTGVAAGKAIITGVYGKQTITVTVNVDVAKRIELSKTHTSLLIGEEETDLELWATYLDGSSVLVNEAAEWSSNNESVADVSNGIITGYKQGTAVITAEYGTKTATITVDVDHTSKLTVEDQSVFLKVNGSQQLKLIATYPGVDAGGKVITKDVTSIATWSSSDASVAYVYKGKVDGYKAGEATITGTYGDKSVEIIVDVAVARYLDLGDDTSIIMDTDSSELLSLTATYADGTTEDVSYQATWTSSNDAVAYVKKGTAAEGTASVYSRSAGTAIITATYGTKTLSTTVEVGAVNKLTADEDNISLQVKGTQEVITGVQPNFQHQIKLTAIGENGSSLDVTSNGTWTTSDKSVVTVSKGLITGISMGTATITAVYNGSTVTIAVEVGIARKLKLSETSLNLAANPSTPTALTLNATLSDGSTPDVTNEATWTSSDNSVVYVSKGQVTAYKEGTATITASYGTKTITASVAVGQSSHIALNYTKLSLGTNQTKELILTSTDINGDSEKVDSSKVTWSSDNETVAYVNNKGMITTYTAGTATIAANFGGKTSTLVVTVGTASKLTVSSNTVNIKVDGKYQAFISTTYKDSEDTGETITDEAVWTTKDATIAVVEDGLITGIKAGTTVVTGKYGNLTVTITVNVGLVDDLVANFQLIALMPAETEQIKLTAIDSDGAVIDVTANATWTSSKATVAGVKNGFVTAYAKGKTTITAAHGGQKVTINVEVDQVSLITLTMKSDGAKDVTATNLSMKSGATKDVAVIVTLNGGRVIDVTNEAVWTTASYKVATVDDGNIKAVDYGKTTITAKYAGKSVKLPITVDMLKYLTVDKVIVNLTVGETVQLKALATYVDGVEADATKLGLWTSSRAIAASVKDGLITANSKGTANITVKYGNIKTKIKVVVTAK